MATSYANFGGSGSRLGHFQISSTLTHSTRSLNYLVDGDTTSSGFWFDSQTVTGKYLEFAILGSERVVDKFRIYQQSTSDSPSFKFQGYDGSTWTDLLTFNWPTTSGATEFTFANATTYRRYRFLGVSGNIGTQNVHEIEFSVESYSPYETGDRSGIITVTSSGLVVNGGSVQNYVDGSESPGSTNSWYPAGGQALNGTQSLTFALSSAQTFVGAQFADPSSSNGNNGVWKFQGSSDGTSYADISDPFTWNSGVGNGSAGVLFSAPGSYSFYRLISVSGQTSSVPWYAEIKFDAGPAPDWPSSLLVAAESSEVLTHGPGSSLLVAAESSEVLTQGPGSVLDVTTVHVSVLTSLLPAGELRGDTNAGIYDDITEFGGDVPIEPLVLEVHFADESVLDVDINVNVGNPFKMKMFDDTILRAVPTRSLSAKFVDDARFRAEIGSLPPPTIQTFVLVSGR